MSHSAQDRELFQSETSSEYLNTRININEQNSRIRLPDWLFRKLKISAAEKILDVGCGTGYQSLRFLETVGSKGRVCATDISQESVSQLIKASKDCPYLETKVGDMVDLKNMLQNNFSISKFDLAHSSYALYYANDHIEVLSAMKDSLAENGRLAVFGPHSPHGMVEFIRNFCDIPAAVDESLYFGPNVLEPYFRENFWEVEIHFFQNELKINSVEDFMSLYRATTYFKEATLARVASAVEAEINMSGAVRFAKNGILFLGSEQKG